MSRNSVTSCGNGGGLFADEGGPVEGGADVDGADAAVSALGTVGVVGGVGAVDEDGDDGVVGSIEVRTLLRRGHESVDRRRIRVATDDVADAHSDAVALGLAELTVVEERELHAPAEVDHADQSGHAVERTGLAAEVALERRPDE